ncbi:MAG: nucleotide sugar dehydrogenase [Kiritimatiellae bacterium]|nr:nucleotide sugar dehydrogenase [Kiritimatiellia bacterium]
MKKTGIIGLWHQGVVGAACLAGLGFDVLAADPNEQTVRRLRAGRPPLFEPGLEELLRKNLRAGRLRFTANLQAVVKNRPLVLLMSDTPVDEKDRSDLSGIFGAARKIAPALENDSVILVTAQVPVGTCALLEAEIRKKNPALRFSLAYSPENLQLGRAIERFLNPPLRVIGADNERAFARLVPLLSAIGGKWERTSLVTAEMVKHALNGYLAVSLAFGNELGNLCDKTGADGFRLAEILRAEPRIGRKAMLMPGLGFAGGTLARDMQTLRGLGRRCGVKTPLLNGAWQSNIIQNRMVVLKLRRALKPLAGRKITVLGLAYKPGTSALRRSLSLEIIAELNRANASVTAHDPKADRREIAGRADFRFENNPYRAARGADALLLLTGWKEYKNLDYGRIRKTMAGDLLIDANNILNRADLVRAGFRYIGFGRGFDAAQEESTPCRK